MPQIPSRLVGNSRIAQEWNKVNDWFRALSTNWFSSDGTIDFELSQDGLLLRAVDKDVIRAGRALEDIDNGCEGNAIVLEFDQRNFEYTRRETGIRWPVRSDFSPGVKSGDDFIAGLFIDGNWQILLQVEGGGDEIVLGILDEPMQRSGTVSMTLDGGDEQNVFDPGQIPADIELNAGNRVTATAGCPGILISFDCDDVTNLAGDGGPLVEEEEEDPNLPPGSKKKNGSQDCPPGNILWPETRDPRFKLVPGVPVKLPPICCPIGSSPVPDGTGGRICGNLPPVIDRRCTVGFTTHTGTGGTSVRCCNDSLPTFTGDGQVKLPCRKFI